MVGGNGKCEILGNFGFQVLEGKREREREDFCLKIFERGVKDFWRKEKIESGGVLKNFKDKIVIWFVLAE